MEAGVMAWSARGSGRKLVGWRNSGQAGPRPQLRKLSTVLSIFATRPASGAGATARLVTQLAASQSGRGLADSGWWRAIPS
jgi:hypothetical protein